MSEAIEICTKPRIVVTDVDYERLTNLAAAVRERSPDVAGSPEAQRPSRHLRYVSISAPALSGS